jgi:hypothetical protein
MSDSFSWTQTVVSFIGGALGATIGSYYTSYFSERAKNFATKADLGELQKQLRENTEITQSIASAYSKKQVLWQSELEYREHQLSELYGPAYAYVKSQKELYDLWMARKMDEKNSDIKTLFSQQNQILRDLIISKAHLIEGPTMPDSFVRLFTSTLIFVFYAAPNNDGSVPDKLKGAAEYPTEFDKHVIKTTELLKKRIDALHVNNAPPLEPQT